MKKIVLFSIILLLFVNLRPSDSKHCWLLYHGPSTYSGNAFACMAQMSDSVDEVLCNGYTNNDIWKHDLTDIITGSEYSNLFGVITGSGYSNSDCIISQECLSEGIGCGTCLNYRKFYWGTKENAAEFFFGQSSKQYFKQYPVECLTPPKIDVYDVYEAFSDKRILTIDTPKSVLPPYENAVTCPSILAMVEGYPNLYNDPNIFLDETDYMNSLCNNICKNHDKGNGSFTDVVNSMGISGLSNGYFFCKCNGKCTLP